MLVSENRLVSIRRGIRFQNGSRFEVSDTVAEEVCVDIVLEGYRVHRVVTSPHMLYELAIGYAFSEGFDIDGANVFVDFGKECIEVVVRGVRPTSSPRPMGRRTVGASELLELYRRVVNSAKLFQISGCFHFAALIDVNGAITIVEDIGRYCALDKAIGSVLRKGSDPRSCIAILSARANRKLVEKIANSGIPIAAFRGAPTAQAIDLAYNRGLTLIAYLRENRFTVYTHEYRLVA